MMLATWWLRLQFCQFHSQQGIVANPAINWIISSSDLEWWKHQNQLTNLFYICTDVPADTVALYDHTSCFYFDLDPDWACTATGFLLTLLSANSIAYIPRRMGKWAVYDDRFSHNFACENRTQDKKNVDRRVLIISDVLLKILSKNLYQAFYVMLFLLRAFIKGNSCRKMTC